MISLAKTLMLIQVVYKDGVTFGTKSVMNYKDWDNKVEEKEYKFSEKLVKRHIKNMILSESERLITTTFKVMEIKNFSWLHGLPEL